jgi:hypothetical protein
MSDKWLQPADLPILFHQFVTVKLKNPRCIWLNDIFHENGVDIAEAKRVFGDAFGYMGWCPQKWCMRSDSQGAGSPAS